MAHIHYLCEKKTAEVDDPDMTILEVSIAHKIRHYRECGGHGRCTTCRIRILNGMH
ncbi:MAG: 2Fe-2S iron-sulfur cluster-binding protein, partial [Gammaproteobacteria bacterium]